MHAVQSSPWCCHEEITMCLDLCVLWALAKQFVYSESDVPLISEESDMSQTDV